MKDSNSLPIYIRLADSTMKRFPDLSDKWNHEYGVVLKGIEDIWVETGDSKYFDYIKRSIDPNIDENGDIKGYVLESYELDNINTGRLLFNLYKETKDEKYKKAAYKLRSQFDTHPRTSFGNFVHKKQFPNQIFIDSIYMGLMFYAQFGKEFHEEVMDDVVNQIINAAKFNQDEETGLLVQGYHENKSEIWADPETGLSSSFWGRGIGWYSVGVVEALEYLSEDHPKREKLIEIFQKLMAGVVKVQDKKSGVWYQVVDKGDLEGNYLEASASCMFTYSLAKGVRLGFLDSSYKEAANKAYKGLIDEFIEIDENGDVNLNGTCKSAGLGVYSHRDGSFEYYISEATSKNDHKGVGTFLMAGVQIELLNK